MIVGAILGVVGSVFNRGLSIFETRQQAKIDDKIRSDELEVTKLNVKKETIAASYEHDKKLGEDVSVWVSNIRALVRPSITAYALGLVTVFYFAGSEASKALLVAMAADLATMTVTWWFADRFKR